MQGLAADMSALWAVHSFPPRAGNLAVHVSVEERRADFFVAAPIERGDELTFNYGEGFWLAARQRPSEGTDSRSFDDPACSGSSLTPLDGG